MKLLGTWLTGSRSGSEDQRKDWAEQVRWQTADEERLQRVLAERSRAEILSFAI
jgi:hypothetical protein